MKQKVITITTDFGDQFAASQLCAVIAQLGFDGHIIENHSVTPFAISEGAFEIEQIARFSKNGSVHVGVVDPGVGSDRFGVIVQTSRSWFVGPNNGLLYPAAKKEGIVRVWKIDELSFGSSVANTFHGRDVFVKAAVYLAIGTKPCEFSCEEIQENILEKILFAEGEILHIDAYGNCKIYWPHELVIGKQLLIKTKESKQIAIPIVKTFDDVAPNKPLAYLGSHDTLELAVNLNSAKDFFNFQLSEVLQIEEGE